MRRSQARLARLARYSVSPSAPCPTAPRFRKSPRGPNPAPATKFSEALRVVFRAAGLGERRGMPVARRSRSSAFALVSLGPLERFFQALGGLARLSQLGAKIPVSPYSSARKVKKSAPHAPLASVPRGAFTHRCAAAGREAPAPTDAAATSTDGAWRSCGVRAFSSAWP